MLVGFDQRATIKTAVAAGDYTTVAKAELRCRLCRPGMQAEAANDDRPDATVTHFLLYEPGYTMPAAALVEVDGERWKVVEGSDDLARGPGGAVAYRRCGVVRAT